MVIFSKDQAIICLSQGKVLILAVNKFRRLHFPGISRPWIKDLSGRHRANSRVNLGDLPNSLTQDDGLGRVWSVA